MGNKFLILLIATFFSGLVSGQGFFDKMKDKKAEKKIIKTGPYFGVQSGKFYAGEIGVERQWKQGKLMSPNTHALHFGVNYTYDFSRWNPVLGYDIGYWFRKSNVGLTWGGSLCMRSNFEDYRFGIVPTIGYKVWQVHIQTGYHILYPFKNSDPNSFVTNTLFLSARFVLVNDRDVKKKDN
jgi:hypothetical protein